MSETIGSKPHIQWQPACFWQSEGDRLVCTLCPFRCELHDGQTGLCRVRRRRDDHLETATFASSVQHWQAIERKPLYHVHPGSQTLTLAAPGCTFRCDYCQNSRLSQYGRDGSINWTAQPIDVAQIVTSARTQDAMIALSYSEPALAAELTLALWRDAHDHGVQIVWKSNGFLTPEALGQIAPALAAVNIDLKAVDDDAHRHLTGAPVEPVLASLRAFRAHGIWLEVSTPLIPGFNTEPAQLAALAEQVYQLGPDVPWHLLRFHPDYKRLNASPTSPETLAQAVTIAKDVGLRYIYVERALGERGRCTYCPNCGVEVVTRDIWALRHNALRNGSCAECGETIPGRW